MYSIVEMQNFVKSRKGNASIHLALSFQGSTTDLIYSYTINIARIFGHFSMTTRDSLESRYLSDLSHFLGKCNKSLFEC